MQSFAIIPAAGRSQRMGQPKLLLPWRGATVIEHVIAAWQESWVDTVVMVVHPDDRQLIELGQASGAVVLEPDQPPPEMKASVRLALEYLAMRWAPAETDAWLIAPADMPTLSTPLIDRLIEVHRASIAQSAGTSQENNPTIRVPVHAGRRGHPVLFPWALAYEVPLLGEDEGLNAIVNRATVDEIEAGEEAIPPEMNTPEDYRRLLERYGD